MSYQKFKTTPYRVGGRHHSSTISTECEITRTGQKMFNGKSVQGKRKKSLIVSDNTIEAGRLSLFFKNLGDISDNEGTEVDKKFKKIPQERWISEKMVLQKYLKHTGRVFCLKEVVKIER